MTDDPVEQALAELQDLVRCRCHPAYTGRGLRDPDCECDSAEAVTIVANRIEELEAKLAEQIEWVKRLADDLIAAEGHEARLKEKLAKAVEALKFYAEADNYEDQHKPESCGCCYYLHDAEIKEDQGAKARTTLAELTGAQKDGN